MLPKRIQCLLLKFTRVGGESFDILRTDWIDNDNNVNYIQLLEQWLGNPTIAHAPIDPSVRNWITEALSEDNPDEHVLRNVLLRLAERWFGGIAALDTFQCIHGLYNKVNPLPVLTALME